jgi:hypothetical protein
MSPGIERASGIFRIMGDMTIRWGELLPGVVDEQLISAGDRWKI